MALREFAGRLKPRRGTRHLMVSLCRDSARHGAHHCSGCGNSVPDFAHSNYFLRHSKSLIGWLSTKALHRRTSS
jgi:hypothetical protein